MHKIFSGVDRPLNTRIPDGFEFYTWNSGMYLKEREDVLLIRCEKPAKAAAVFTTNALPAAPVRVGKELLAKNSLFSGVFINTGYANAATGKVGIDDCIELADFIKVAFDCDFPLIPLSTGVIGARIPLEKIKNTASSAVAHRDLKRAASAIMTTDTYPKYFSVEGSGYTIAGISKGAGMIAPSMATTLTVVLTDADISSLILKKSLIEAIEKTFNRISVDGEQSTNDTALILSVPVKKPQTPFKEEFSRLLTDVLYELSMMVLKDGEGAKKVIKISCRRFLSKLDAESAAKTIATSPLVKTAIAGADPNWGRVFCALGNSGARVDEPRLTISIGSTVVFAGEPVEFDEDKLRDYLKGEYIEIEVDAGTGKHDYEFYTCDLTEEYVKINASYRS